MVSILHSTRIQILWRRAGVVNDKLAGIWNSRIPHRLYYFSTSSSSFIQQQHRTTVSHTGGPCSSCCLLHHEWIVPDSTSAGSAIRSSTVITGDDKEPIRTIPSSSGRPVVVFLHGLLGNCKNLRTLAKRLVQETGITALLMDLRGHGQSRHCFDTTSSGNNDNDHDIYRDQRIGGHQKEQTFAAMQQEDSVSLNNNNNNNMVTIQSCAEDVIYTLCKLNLIGENSPRGIVGHSFGGRCALAYHHHLLLRTSSSDGGGGHIMGTSPNNAYLHPPQDCWILDSCPGKIHSSVRKVVEAVASIDMPIQSKKELVRILTKEKNLDPSIAAWMTTNLKSVGDATAGAGAGEQQQQQYEFMFDLNVIQDILQDFPRQDMMRMLQECFMTGPNGSEAGAAIRGNIHMVIASKNKSWTSDILEQLETIRQGNDFKNKNALASMQLNLLHLDAGHWVHVDALDELVVAMAKGLVNSD
jgi:Predicted hydrolases or acyltransferases (alpha/beta hydrolase superfamily)